MRIGTGDEGSPMTGVRWVRCLVAAFVFAGAGAPAVAIPFDATLRFDVGHTAGPLIFTGAGAGSSSASGVILPASVFSGIESVERGRFSAPFGIFGLSQVAVKVLGNGAGGFAGSPLAGTMPVRGAALFKGNLGAGPITWIRVPLFTPHTAASAADVGLGVGGQWSRQYATAAGTLALDAFHTSWSAGMHTVTALPYYVYYHVPTGKQASFQIGYRYDNATAMYTGTDSRTPGGLGQLTLVSPTKVTLYSTGLLSMSEVILGTLTLSFVPEPGTGLLLGAGVAFLAFLGRRRMR